MAEQTQEASNPLAKLGAGIAAFQTILASIAAALAGANGGLVSVVRNYPQSATVFVLFIALGIIGGVIVSAIASDAGTTTRIRSSIVMFAIAAILAIYTWASRAFTEPGSSGDGGTWAPLILAIGALVGGGLTWRWEQGKQRDAQQQAPAPAPDATPGKVRAVARPALSGVALPALVLVLSATVFLLGCYGMGGLLVANVRATTNPTITGSLEETANGFMLKATVSTTGLLRSQHVLVRVDGLSTGSANWSYDVIFAQRMGSDEHGNVTSEISVPIDPATWRQIVVRPFVDDTQAPAKASPNADAEQASLSADPDSTSTTIPVGKHDHEPANFGATRFCDTGDDSCLQFLIPHVDNTPELMTTFTVGANGPGILKVTGTAKGLQHDRTRSDVLEITVVSAEPSNQTLASYTTPSVGGSATTTFDVPIPPEISGVTVFAKVLSPGSSATDQEPTARLEVRTG